MNRVGVISGWVVFILLNVLVTYAMFAFVNLSFNPIVWGALGRSFFAAVASAPLLWSLRAIYERD